MEKEITLDYEKIINRIKKNIKKSIDYIGRLVFIYIEKLEEVEKENATNALIIKTSLVITVILLSIIFTNYIFPALLSLLMYLINLGKFIMLAVFLGCIALGLIYIIYEMD